MFDLIWILTQNKNLLFEILSALIVLALFIRWMPQRTSDSRSNRRRRQRAKEDAKIEKRRYEEEFLIAVGQPRSRYVFRTLSIAFFLAVIVFIALGSFALAIVVFVGFYRWRMGRAKNRVSQLRSGLLSDEVIPAARAIASALATGMSLSQALADLARDEKNQSPLKRSIRRVLADPRGLEEALRAEEARANIDLVREFFEILTEGAAAARNTSVTANTLDKFAELNQRRQTNYRMAMLVTVQARGTRNMLLWIIPFLYFMGLFVSGSDAMLKTPAGNIITLAIAGSMALSLYITNRIINGAVKGL